MEGREDWRSRRPAREDIANPSGYVEVILNRTMANGKKEQY